jgi:hypothetical protein
MFVLAEMLIRNSFSPAFGNTLLAVVFFQLSFAKNEPQMKL